MSLTSVFKSSTFAFLLPEHCFQPFSELSGQLFCRVFFYTFKSLLQIRYGVFCLLPLTVCFLVDLVKFSLVALIISRSCRFVFFWRFQYFFFFFKPRLPHSVSRCCSFFYFYILLIHLCMQLLGFLLLLVGPDSGPLITQTIHSTFHNYVTLILNIHLFCCKNITFVNQTLLQNTTYEYVI